MNDIGFGLECREGGGEAWVKGRGCMFVAGSFIRWRRDGISIKECSNVLGQRSRGV